MAEKSRDRSRKFLNNDALCSTMRPCVVERGGDRGKQRCNCPVFHESRGCSGFFFSTACVDPTRKRGQRLMGCNDIIDQT